ncbi:nitrite reductase (NAD(P)H) small subunit [Streptosporangium nondiastaticum]|uniref:Nitrite reductase (NAD(P)H) small subunit n=1 Tax=Streptosporangium nondiastaticum TaxID=35764 RepID=A0A9X7JT73_9ACTN|nr:nitrite reductase (NAD(P)H) small subunit [Streptosporangium nondiastaticum]PSJ29251.1 nitrite reductase (NAD(P)H) small subunit [Streptosporangium nondiastaticum]
MTVAPEQLPPAPASAPAPARASVPASLRVEALLGRRWHALCELGDLTPGRGVAVLLPDGQQAAVFVDRAGRAYAIGNQDPFSGAFVLARGPLGSAGGRPYVTSPPAGRRFDLTDGRCLDDAAVSVPAYTVRLR